MKLRQRKLSQELIARMQADRSAGVHPNDICKKYSVSNWSVYSYTKAPDVVSKFVARAAKSQDRLTHLAEGAEGEIISVSPQPAPAPVNGASNAAAPAANGGVLCGIDGCTAVLKNAVGRGIHLARQHRIEGKSHKYRLNALAKKQKGELQHADSHSFISPNGNTTPEENYHLSRAFGRVQGYLQDYAGSLNLPAATFAYRVGELLQSEARGMLVGPALPLPSVRRAASRRM